LSTNLASTQAHKEVVLSACYALQLAHKAAERAKRSIAAEYGIPLHPTYTNVQQLEQQQHNGQQQQEASSAAAEGSSDDSGSDADDPTAAASAADTNGPADEAAAAAAAAAAGAQPYMSAYHRGDPRPITGILLAQQARAAAIALVRFGEGIPAARKRQLEGLVARYVGRWVGNVYVWSCTVVVSCPVVMCCSFLLCSATCCVPSLLGSCSAWRLILTCVSACAEGAPHKISCRCLHHCICRLLCYRCCC
jgi:hypothetical protein